MIVGSEVTNGTPLLQATELCVALGRKEILRDLTFSVHPGTLVGLLGPNGSGKTTLLRALGGLLPYRGSLAFCGKEVIEWKTRNIAQHVASVQQGAHFLFDFTVQEMVLLGRSPYKRFLESASVGDHVRMRHALTQVDLAGYEHRSVLSLSGGERQRVWLAQALVRDPQLLLLDEPTAHLDVHHLYGFLQYVRNLVDAGQTAIVAFHDIALAARFCNHLLILENGCLAALGGPEQILTESLLASVFKMATQITSNEDAPLNISFERPITE